MHLYTSPWSKKTERRHRIFGLTVVSSPATSIYANKEKQGNASPMRTRRWRGYHKLRKLSDWCIAKNETRRLSLRIQWQIPLIDAVNPFVSLGDAALREKTTHTTDVCAQEISGSLRGCIATFPRWFGIWRQDVLPVAMRLTHPTILLCSNNPPSRKPIHINTLIH